MEYPRQSASVHVEEVGGELCVYNRAGQEVHSLNRTAALVWRRCDGGTSPADMVAALRGELGSTDASAIVGLALDELDRANLLAEPRPRTAVQASLTRRVLLKRGVTAALLPVVASLAAPRAAAAQSAVCSGLSLVINGVVGSGSSAWPSTTGTMSPRIERNGVASVCGQTKVCGPFGQDSRYDAYTFANNCGTSRCVGITIVSSIPPPGVHAAVYMPSFNNVSVCTNYLADCGTSSADSTPQPQSFTVPNGSSFVLVVFHADQTAAASPYQVTLTGSAAPFVSVPGKPGTYDTK